MQNMTMDLLGSSTDLNTVSLSLLEPKQKPRNQRSMDPINIHIGQLKTAFT